MEPARAVPGLAACARREHRRKASANDDDALAPTPIEVEEFCSFHSCTRCSPARPLSFCCRPCVGSYRGECAAWLGSGRPCNELTGCASLSFRERGCRDRRSSRRRCSRMAPFASRRLALGSCPVPSSLPAVWSADCAALLGRTGSSADAAPSTRRRRPFSKSSGARSVGRGIIDELFLPPLVRPRLRRPCARFLPFRDTRMITSADACEASLGFVVLQKAQRMRGPHDDVDRRLRSLVPTSLSLSFSSSLSPLSPLSPLTPTRIALPPSPNKTPNPRCRLLQAFARTARSADTCPRATAAWESTASIPEAAETPAASTTTGS